MTLARISLVTVTYNAAAVIGDFWTSLVAQEGVDWSLVVVDNASTDDTAAALDAIETDPRVTVIRCAMNTGAAEGNNIALRHVLIDTPDFVVLTNNDVLFEPDVLRRLVERKRELPAGVIAPLMVYEDDRTTAWFAKGEISMRWGVRCVHLAAPDKTGVYASDYAPTTFLVFDRAVMEVVGELDAAYFAYWEDADYIWRVRKAGFGLWVDPEIAIVHKVSQSSGGAGSVYSNRQYYRNQVRFAHKHLGRLACAYTVGLNIIRIGARAAARLDDSAMTRAKFGGMIDGITALLKSPIGSTSTQSTNARGR